MVACDICGKQFESVLSLGGHKSGHARQGKIYKSKPPKTTPTCKVCGKEFESGWQVGGHQRTCGKPFDEVGETLRRRMLFEEAGNACTQCGENRRRPCGGIILEVDHIDGDHTNNSRENLRVLCPTCHALTPNFRNWGRPGQTKTSGRIRGKQRLRLPQ